MRHSDRSKRTPYVKPVQRVELSEKNIRIRMILIVVLLAIAVVSILTGLSSALRTEPGWQEITVEAKQANCGKEFVLNYDFSDAGSAATSQFKTLTALYSTACVDAFHIFSPDVQSDDLLNVHYLNAYPNETVTVDPILYNALSLVQQHRNRHIYLAAVYAEYDRIFQSENDVAAAEHDPVQNPALMEYISEAASFANDPAKIDIQLLGENQVKLLVSDDYLAFLEEYEIETLIDFGWMKNAFIADYLAQVLADNGFTAGYLASYDGFTRNLDTRGNSYSFNVFDRQVDGIYMPAVLTYAAPSAIVFLRDYPMVQSDAWHYYAFPNGRIASLLIDPADGRNKSSIDSLVSYGANQSCAELLLQMVPVFISDEFSTDSLQAMAANGIHSIWCVGQTLRYTDADANLSLQPQENMTYTKVYAG